ncbi:radical SAM protein [Hyphobacterium sp. HN65]|uniref:Radical SAM protein n=1 Tax=Hyphobacterium lacteum TaxID=3116575 RepID=A0ABU7LPY0_9PROT|nr:radical SAM protein [Hyphobacterium sp. HN65]MEE2525960.1 radical SAM protein [Hyphobacterium sp. HN65]
MPDGQASRVGGDQLVASQFNCFVPSAFDSIVLMYNAASGAFAAVSVEEFEDIAALMADPGSAPAEEVSKLTGAGFLVPASRDERADVRSAYFEGRAAETGLNLTIAPTVSCNFACSYCFEEHPKRHFSDEDFQAVTAYVRENLDAGAPLSVTWFGGEPLAAFRQLKALDTALQAIADGRGSTYTQFMITNGSLLTEERIAYFASRPGFTGAQVTIDGPADIHDARRFTSAGKPSFEKIMRNLKAIAGRMAISLRINLDRQNVDRIPELIDLIIGEGIADWVSPYFGHVVDYTDECGDLASTMLTREEFAAAEIRLFNLMIRKGLRPGLDLPRPQAGSLCVGDAPGGAVISPGGLVFRCWNETALPEGEAYARIDDRGGLVRNGVKEERERFWKAYDPFTHAECADCTVQPLCRGGCPWEADKRPTDGPGHCTPLRYNLPDLLRLIHLRDSIDAIEPGGERPLPRQTV